MKLILTVCNILFIGSFCVKAQTDSTLNQSDFILSDSSFMVGVYKTFEEFKYNSPSITIGYRFNGKKIWIENNGRWKRVKKSNIWGISDGKTVLVRWRKYNPIRVMGRYCYFEEKGVRIFSAVAFPLIPIALPIPYTDRVIINFNTGKFFILDKKLMLHILSTDDPELLKTYLIENPKERQLEKYVIEYNNRNFNRIRDYP